MQLTAVGGTIRRRLSHRDREAVLEQHLLEAKAMTGGLQSANLEGIVISTDGQATEALAAEIIARLGWPARS